MGKFLPSLSLICPLNLIRIRRTPWGVELSERVFSGGRVRLFDFHGSPLAAAALPNFPKLSRNDLISNYSHLLPSVFQKSLSGRQIY